MIWLKDFVVILETFTWSFWKIRALLILYISIYIIYNIQYYIYLYLYLYIYTYIFIYFQIHLCIWKSYCLPVPSSLLLPISLSFISVALGLAINSFVLKRCRKVKIQISIFVFLFEFLYIWNYQETMPGLDC